jgi:hypothetical protein
MLTSVPPVFEPVVGDMIAADSAVGASVNRSAAVANAARVRDLITRDPL